MGKERKISDQLRQFAKLDVDGVFRNLKTSFDGLEESDARKRLNRYGQNFIADVKKRHPILILLSLFLNPLPLMLLALSLVSFFTGETRGAEVIILMVFLSTTLAFVQESRSNRAAESLRSLVRTTASVKRRSAYGATPAISEIELSLLVPGDIVHLSAGDLVPADLRLLSAKDLFVNQSSLTGESMPVEKYAKQMDAPVSGDSELFNLCFMGTHVISGTAIGVVVATGKHTFFGSIAATIAEDKEQTDFDLGVQKYIWLIIRIMMLMVPAVFLINGLAKGNWIEALLFASAVAVGLAPEMLPMLVTINLAKGGIEMSRKKVIVKRLNAIQNFGAMDILCVDKTGTLTQDRVILEKHVDISGMESEWVLELAYLNSYYQSGLKNLLDHAVLEHAQLHEKLSTLNTFQKIDEIPFDFERRRMSVIVSQEQSTNLLICKGAVEELFSVCSYCRLGGEIVPLEPGQIEDARQMVKSLNSEGFRVIAVAYRNVPKNDIYEAADESGLILSGYIAFLDPPKESAEPAIKALNEYGVAVKILTGDNQEVSVKICHDVGIPAQNILAGTQLDQMSDAELAAAAELVSVFVKLHPQQKARIIRALQHQGHVVGFMGDGINDGPALKAADVGISVDNAVDIAKESADIILMEKNLMVIKEGLIEGRKVFGNITKYIRMSASSNFGNMLSVLGASAFLPFLPMAPVQIMLNNLMYDFSQTAVATDTVDEEYISRPRKWEIGNLARYIFTIGPISSVFDYLTFGLMWFVFKCNAPEHLALFQTAWFVESLLSQTLIVHIIRTGRIPFLQSKPSKPLLLTTVAICLIGAYLPYSSFASKLQMVPLPSEFWLYLSAILVLYLGLTQAVKVFLIKHFGFD